MRLSQEETVPTVLLVESDVNERVASQNGLETHGFRVLPAQSGQKALDLCHSQKIDVAVVESLLPDMHGLDVIGHIASECEGVSIVLCTSDPGCVNSFRSWAADAIVEESPDASELVRHVTALLQH